MDKGKAIGAYLGAAIGDAMGGPVECQHAARIKKHYGEVNTLLPYRKPPGLMELHSGYALHGEPGSITDDTYIRVELTRFFFETEPPRTAEKLAHWMFQNADFNQWPYPAVKPLIRVVRGDLDASEAGMTAEQGGFNGWWTPVGILHAGKPDQAAAETRSLSAIWKAPLELDLISAIQAALAEALGDKATWESVIQAMLNHCGPLATQLVERAVDIGKTASSHDDLVQRVYSNCLYDEAPTANDAPLPDSIEPVDYADGTYTSVLLAEQVPLEVAAFVYGKGTPESIPYTVRLGRDCDSTATTVGSWVGALHGESGLPSDWIETVQKANLVDFDLREIAERLYSVSNKE